MVHFVEGRLVISAGGQLWGGVKGEGGSKGGKCSFAKPCLTFALSRLHRVTSPSLVFFLLSFLSLNKYSLHL